MAFMGVNLGNALREALVSRGLSFDTVPNPHVV